MKKLIFTVLIALTGSTARADCYGGSYNSAAPIASVPVATKTVTTVTTTYADVTPDLPLASEQAPVPDGCYGSQFQAAPVPVYRSAAPCRRPISAGPSCGPNISAGPLYGAGPVYNDDLPVQLARGPIRQGFSQQFYSDNVGVGGGLQITTNRRVKLKNNNNLGNGGPVIINTRRRVKIKGNNF